MKKYSLNIGYESFLGPELFFSPQIIEKNCKYSLDEIIDLTIQQCPIEYHKRLYSNIILIGGNTYFKNLDNKLKTAVQKRIDKRLYFPGRKTHRSVNVSKIEKHVVWLGESLFASNKEFRNFVVTREDYLEKGPMCFQYFKRWLQNGTFNSL